MQLPITSVRRQPIFQSRHSRILCRSETEGGTEYPPPPHPTDVVPGGGGLYHIRPQLINEERRSACARSPAHCSPAQTTKTARLDCIEAVAFAGDASRLQRSPPLFSNDRNSRPVCPSVRRSVHRSVGLSIRQSVLTRGPSHILRVLMSSLSSRA